MALEAANFRLIKKLASGNYGTVVLAEHETSTPHRSELFAMKFVTKRRLKTQEQIDRIKTELRVLTECCPSSPFLVHNLAAFQTHHAVIFAFEYCEGGDLFFHLLKTSQRGFGETTRTKIMLMQIASGIAHLHSFGIIWRDVKMENVLVTGSGSLKLCDFGLVKFLKKRTKTFFNKQEFETTRTRCVGTTDYLSPQSVQGMPYGLEHDWWGFGVLAYEMCCGFLPFRVEGKADKTYREIVRNRPYYRHFLYPATQQFLRKLLTSPRRKRLGFHTGVIAIQRDAFFLKVGDWNEAVKQNPVQLQAKHGRELAEFFDPKQCVFENLDSEGEPDKVIEGFQEVDPILFQKTILALE